MTESTYFFPFPCLKTLRPKGTHARRKVQRGVDLVMGPQNLTLVEHTGSLRKIGLKQLRGDSLVGIPTRIKRVVALIWRERVETNFQPRHLSVRSGGWACNSTAALIKELHSLLGTCVGGANTSEQSI
eukprot:580886-Rhodomonas_salina.1